MKLIRKKNKNGILPKGKKEGLKVLRTSFGLAFRGETEKTLLNRTRKMVVPISNMTERSNVESLSPLCMVARWFLEPPKNK